MDDEIIEALASRQQGGIATWYCSDLNRASERGNRPQLIADDGRPHNKDWAWCATTSLATSGDIWRTPHGGTLATHGHTAGTAMGRWRSDMKSWRPVSGAVAVEQRSVWPRSMELLSPSHGDSPGCSAWSRSRRWVRDQAELAW